MAPEPHPQDIAVAIADSEPWIVDGLQESTARAETLINALNKNHGTDALTAPCCSPVLVSLFCLMRRARPGTMATTTDPDCSDRLQALFQRKHAPNNPIPISILTQF